MSVLQVIMVHGIGDAQRDYSLDLQRQIVNHFKSRGIVGDNDDVARIIRFHEVRWDDVGRDEEMTLWDKLYPDLRWGNWLNRSLSQVTEFSDIRNFIVHSLGDVFIYLSSDGATEIKKRVRDKILEVKAFQEADYPQGQDENGFCYVTIVGNSLGSVVVYDVATEFRQQMKDQVSRQAFDRNIGRLELSNLFTMASPLGIFSLLQDQSWYQESDDNVVKVRQDGVWWNFIDGQDLIAYPLERVYPRSGVKDFKVDTGFLPLGAHLGYWKNDDVAIKIAERLEKDYHDFTRSGSGGN